MVDYLNPTQALNTLTMYPNKYPKCAYYEIDEPIKYNYSSSDTKALENLIASWNTGAKVMVTDFHWPANSSCVGWLTNYGAEMGPYIATNNAYVMCDQYDGDQCGSECTYWDEYSNYYNPSHVMSNWVKNQTWYTSAWDCAFKLANGSDQNINQIWLYAGTGDITAIQTFCLYAWYNGWLVRQMKQIEEIWECHLTNPCVNCIYPTTYNLTNTYYTGQIEYVSY